MTLAQAEAMASTIDDLMRPPPVAKVRIRWLDTELRRQAEDLDACNGAQIRQPTAVVASSGVATAATTAAAIVRRTSRPQTPNSQSNDHLIARGGVSSAPLAGTLKSEHRHGTANASTPQRLTLHDLATERPASVSKDGDVSGLISSDSDSDEDVLTPNFSASSTRTRLSASSSAAGSRRVASIASQSTSSSRPTSPALSSVSSRSSSSSSSNSSSASRSRAPPAQYTRPPDKLSMRPRPSSSEHAFPVSRFVSDSDGAASKQNYYYYSDNNRPSSASSTTSSFSTSSSLSTSTAMSVDGMRRRIPHVTAGQAPAGSTGAPHAPAKVPWVECFDATSGNVYYYNQVTGESRWQRGF